MTEEKKKKQNFHRRFPSSIAIVSKGE